MTSPVLRVLRRRPACGQGVGRSAGRYLLLTFSSLALCLARPATAANGWACRQGSEGQWVCAGAAIAQVEPAPLQAAPEPNPDPAAPLQPQQAAVAPELPAAPPRPPRRPADAEPAWPPYPVVEEVACGPPGRAAPVAAEPRRAPDQPAEVQADQAYYAGPAATYTFVGDVLLERWDQQLLGDYLVYDETSGRVDAVGPFGYRDRGLAFNAGEGFFYLDEDRGELEQVRYRLRSSHAHGQAEQVEIENAARARYRSVTYTTCPVGDEDWWLRASTLITDRDSGIGTAYNARLAFFGVPLMYLPYVSFPIDDRRKTGFLAPSIGQSGDEGLSLVTPFYWNIAPNYDATLTPHYMANRGLLLGTEFRYLRPSFYGTTSVSYLPDDDLYGDDRWSFGLDQVHRFGPVRLAADVNRVSDDQYLDDFGDDLDATSTTHLESTAVASWNPDRWRLQAEVQTWQTLAEDMAERSYPYRRLPRIHAAYSSAPSELGLAYQFQSDLTRFAHPAEERITGTRLDLAPRVSLPIRRLAYFLEPALALRYTRYQLDPAATSLPETPSRTVPMFSLDSGIFLERDFTLGELPMRQTLEPRLFYLYVPEEDQRDLPLFDTGLAGLSFGRMFSENRFTGLDRVGDANQFTLGLSTRFIGRTTGREYLRLGAAQIFYLEDREVTLGSREPGLEEDRGTSDILFEARSQLSRDFVAQAEYQWDTYDRRSEQGGVRVVYQPDEDSIASATYRLRRSGENRVVEQAVLGAVWPVAPRWRLMATWNYSLLEQTTLEQALGLEYSNCCWNLRILGNRVLADDIGTAGEFEYDNAIMVQIEFTGLTSLGAGVEDYLRDTIYGYDY